MWCIWRAIVYCRNLLRVRDADQRDLGLYDNVGSVCVLSGALTLSSHLHPSTTMGQYSSLSVSQSTPSLSIVVSPIFTVYFCLKFNMSETKIMVFGSQNWAWRVVVKNVEEFEYLGSMTWDNDCSKDIQRQIQKAPGAADFNTLWQNKGISIETKLAVLNVCVWCVS